MTDKRPSYLLDTTVLKTFAGRFSLLVKAFGAPARRRSPHRRLVELDPLTFQDAAMPVVW